MAYDRFGSNPVMAVMYRTTTLPPKAEVRRRRLRALGVHQHEENAAGLRAAVDPRVIGRLLNHDITGLEVRYRVIKHHVDIPENSRRRMKGRKNLYRWCWLLRCDCQQGQVRAAFGLISGAGPTSTISPGYQDRSTLSVLNAADVEEFQFGYTRIVRGLVKLYSILPGLAAAPIGIAGQFRGSR